MDVEDAVEGVEWKQQLWMVEVNGKWRTTERAAWMTGERRCGQGDGQ
jgi:hypothetical protein